MDGAVLFAGAEPTLDITCQVDLGSNALTTWATVADIGAAFPLLEVLTISQNALPHVPPTLLAARAGAGARPRACVWLTGSAHACAGFPYGRLRVLVVSGCGIAWSDVAALEPALPSLEELHACGNGIARLDGGGARCAAASTGVDAAAPAPAAALLLPVAGFSRLTKLNLSGNPLACWAEVERLRWLPELRSLLLNDCGLTEVAWTVEADAVPGGTRAAVAAAAPWARLESLCISALGCACDSLPHIESRVAPRAPARMLTVGVVPPRAGWHCRGRRSAPSTRSPRSRNSGSLLPPPGRLTRRRRATTASRACAA